MKMVKLIRHSQRKVTSNLTTIFHELEPNRSEKSTSIVEDVTRKKTQDHHFIDINVQFTLQCCSKYNVVEQIIEIRLVIAHTNNIHD